MQIAETGGLLLLFTPGSLYSRLLMSIYIHSHHSNNNLCVVNLKQQESRISVQVQKGHIASVAQV